MNEPTVPAPYEHVEQQPQELEKPEGLNEQQIQFCVEYSANQNGKAAAIRAGYSEQWATQIASINLRKPHIRRHIEELQDEKLEQLGVNKFRVLQEIARIGFSDPRNLMDKDGNVMNPNDWDDDTAAAVSSFEVTSHQDDDGNLIITHKVKTWDKGRALGDLSKSLGIAKDDGLKVAVQVIIGEEDAAGF